MCAEARCEILGIGAPIIDYVVMTTDDFLAQLPGEKGGMVPIDYETLLSILKNCKSPPLAIAGGSGANTIKGLAHFGHHCGLIGKIGNDTAGEKFLESMRALKIKPYLCKATTPTAQVACLITPDGERTMRTFLGATQEMTAQDLDPKVFQGVKLVHIEGYSLLNGDLTETAMQYAKDSGAKVSYDLGSFEVVKGHRERILGLLSKYVDIIFGNKDEIQALFQLNPEKGCTALSQLCETAIVLLGKEGCIVGTKSGQVHCPAFVVDAVDTTGAGDLFASGFLHGYLHGVSPEECARYGALTAATVIQAHGVDIPVETWQEIKAKM
jgi:sugar/nucleoside kinase (ribokinase family)